VEGRLEERACDMNVPRNLTNRIRFVLDELLPPALRDSRLFTACGRLVFGRDTPFFSRFKDEAVQYGAADLARTYERVHRYVLQRETDLNDRSLRRVLGALTGGTALEVGCGGGFLAERMSRTHETTACDIVVDRGLRARMPGARLLVAEAASLPFGDASFDTVVCCHTLEHVPDIARAVAELRRVAIRRLVVVVPRQRAYHFTFDLHLHFFPYRYNLVGVLRPEGPFTCEDEGGDWVYIEDLSARSVPSSPSGQRG
jgi:SAM-dependent methyltransferase